MKRWARRNGLLVAMAWVTVLLFSILILDACHPLPDDRSPRPACMWTATVGSQPHCIPSP